MNTSPFRGEIPRLFLILLVSGMAGLLTGSINYCLVFGVFVFLIWHFVQFIRYVSWLFSDKQAIPSDIGGVWGEVYYQNIRLRTKHLKRKQRLAGYLKRFRQLTAALPDATCCLAG